MTPIDVGIVAGDDAAVRATLRSLGRQGADGRVFVLDGGEDPLISLLRLASAPVIALFEAGARPASGALARLGRALRGDVALAGPSTNRDGGAQARPDAPPDAADERVLERFAHRLAVHARDARRDLAGDGFWCVARREVAAALGGGAAELLPRATLAGHRALWIVSAYVHRPLASKRPAQPVTPPTSVAPPLVSCILPTRDRPRFVIEAVRTFLAQDYPAKELVVVDDGDHAIDALLPRDPRIVYLRCERLVLGEKRNLACARARGELIAHFDDDDWYPPTRLSTEVRALLDGGGAVAGSSRVHFFEPATERVWRYAHPRWLSGSTLLYRKSYWAGHHFAPVSDGEDVRFVQAGGGAAKIVDLADERLCVAVVHARNTCLKRPQPPHWTLVDGAEVFAWLGARLDAYREAPHALAPPLVSCVMPTFERAPFVELALAAYDAQTWPRKELVIVDDGVRSVARIAGRRDVRHHRLARRASIGDKRNLGIELARGEIICMWDDDDWYGPSRVATQALPIVHGEADVTGLVSEYVMTLDSGEVWSVTPALHRSMFEGDVAGGTLTFRRALARRARFPRTNLAEDAAWLRSAVRDGARLLRIDNHGEFIYMRHRGNTWRFVPGSFLDPSGWHRVAPPPAFDAATLAAYQRAELLRA